MAMKWRRSFSCQEREIDIQHKHLFEICSKLNILEPISLNVNLSMEIMEVLKELQAYSEYHFEYEEALMKKNSCDHLEKHVVEHQFFCEKLSEYERLVNQFTQEVYLREMIGFITEWIAKHILTVDKNYSEYFK